MRHAEVHGTSAIRARLAQLIQARVEVEIELAGVCSQPATSPSPASTGAFAPKRWRALATLPTRPLSCVA
jgi:hypothetical protein